MKKVCQPQTLCGIIRVNQITFHLNKKVSSPKTTFVDVDNKPKLRYTQPSQPICSPTLPTCFREASGAVEGGREVVGIGEFPGVLFEQCSNPKVG